MSRRRGRICQKVLPNRAHAGILSINHFSRRKGERVSFASYGLAYDLPSHALSVLSALEGAGYEAWAVGGWVRDALAGAPAHDVDVTTSAPWQESERVLKAAGFAVHETGTAHGTVTAVVGGEPIEVTTYRVEGTYSDHRHPDEVRFVTDVREDLARRDFTINAMAYHPERGLLDPFGGKEDLARHVIRAVGEPAARFEEDALRVLRAVRFAARMGFTVEERTHEALIAAAPSLANIAQERIGQELDGIIASGRMAWALLAETEVLCAAVPEITAMVGFDQHSPFHAYTVLEHTARVCRAVEEFTAGVPAHALRWAALLHDIAKPVTFTLDDKGRGHFYGHPREGAKMAEAIMRRLALPKELVAQTVVLVRLHDHYMMPTPRSIRRTLVKLEKACPGHAYALIYQLIDLKRSDAVSKVPSAAHYAVEVDALTSAARREIRHRAPVKVSQLAISGRDVLETTGMAPGPDVGMVLDSLLNAVMNGEVDNEREALLREISFPDE